MTTAAPDLPFVDAHRTSIPATRADTWRGLRQYADTVLAAPPRSLPSRGLRAFLGTVPEAGFEVSEEVAEQRLVMSGRHRFARYALVFELSDGEPGTTTLSAVTYSLFPGPHGGGYRLLVIGTRAHVVATRHLLGSIRSRCTRTVD